MYVIGLDLRCSLDIWFLRAPLRILTEKETDMRRHWKTCVLIFVLIVVALFGYHNRANASVLEQDKPLELKLKNYKPNYTLAERIQLENADDDLVPPPPTPLSIPEKKYDYSIGVGGWSKHDTHGKPNPFKEQNPIIEFDVLFDYSLLGGRPFVGYAHVFKNSRKGTADLLILANHWKLIRGPYVDMCAGAGVMRARYTDPDLRGDPREPRAMSGTLPFFYLCLEKGPVSMRFVPLGKDVMFMYFIYSF